MPEKYYAELDGVLVEVKIVGERDVYGRHEYKIIPVAGAREKWVQEQTVLKGVDIKKVVKHL